MTCFVLFCLFLSTLEVTWEDQQGTPIGTLSDDKPLPTQKLQPEPGLSGLETVWKHEAENIAFHAFEMRVSLYFILSFWCELYHVWIPYRVQW